MKITVVLLTWKRISTLKKTLLALANQTYKNFDVHISNGNLQHSHIVDRAARYFSDRMKITVSHDGNDLYAFRRFPIGNMLAKSGTEVILFIDDDVAFPKTYIENTIKNYKPKTYQSGFAWTFQKNGMDYYRYRTRATSNKNKIHYCGTGVSMIDASIFLESRLFVVPKEAHMVEDLWLSYFAQQVMGWELRYFDIPDVVIGGADSVALYKRINKEKRTGEISYDKADFLRLLVKKYKWKL
jgi:glycosyltransferase involved in cell wall biosynthesis